MKPPNLVLLLLLILLALIQNSQSHLRSLLKAEQNPNLEDNSNIDQNSKLEENSTNQDKNSTANQEANPKIEEIEPECRYVHNIKPEDRCDWVYNNTDCDVDSFIDYTSFMYCAFSVTDQPIALVISIVWMLILFIALGVAATDFLCPALFLISKTMNMSQNVAGVTLIAFGNGSPDIFAAIAGMMSGRPGLVVGGLLGGATFITFIVIGTIFSVKSFKLMPQPFLRDIIFYLIASGWVFYLFIGPGQITLYHAVGFLVFYASYVLLVICSRFWDKSHSNQSGPTLHHGHGSGSKSKDGDEDGDKKKDDLHEIVFEGITPDDDPTSNMVVMKGFMFLGDDVMSDKPPPNSSRTSRTQHLQRNKVSRRSIEANKRYRHENFVHRSVSKSGSNNNDQEIESGSKSGLRNIYTPNSVPRNLPGSNSGSENQIPAIKVVSGSVSESEDMFDEPASILKVKSSSTINGKFKVSNYERNLQTITSLGNELTVTSQKSVSIFDPDNDNNDNNYNSVYNTITSIFTLTQQQREAVRRASKEFLEKITPIDMDGWKHQKWGGKSFEVVKAPIRLFLLLTTPMAEIDDNRTWNKPLSVLHCVTGPLFVVFATGYGFTWIGGVFPVAALVFIIASLICGIIVFTSKVETPPSYYKTYSAYLGFVIAVAWVYFICTEVVSVIRAIGIAFNLSEPTIGMTLLAWGNCLLDFISNVSIAKKGFPRMAVGACLGSPLLALLIGVGIPGTIILATDSKPIYLKSDNLIVIIYIALSLSLVFIVFSTAIFKFVVKRPVGFILITMYAILMAIIALVEWKVLPVHLV